MSDPAAISVDAALAPLRARADTGAGQTLFSGGATQAALGPDLALHVDPAARLDGVWRSPRGRLLELETRVTQPGAWFALHLGLPAQLADLTDVTWLGLAARSSAARAVAVRACLRSGTGDGFHDCILDRHILSQPRDSDHHDLLAPEPHPDLPRQAPWREFILFLPPAEPLDWVLHDLRLFVL